MPILRDRDTAQAVDVHWGRGRHGLVLEETDVARPHLRADATPHSAASNNDAPLNNYQGATMLDDTS
jgi:hypothetical protein